jgi:hypothetical protein
VHGLGTVISAESLFEGKLHNHLEGGRWNISIDSVGKLNSTLGVSREAAELLLDMLKTAPGDAKQPLVKEVNTSSGSSVF